MTQVPDFRNAAKGMPLNELAAELQRQRSVKRDFEADTSEMTVTSDNGLALQIGGVNEEFPINQHALRQIGTRLDIPAKFTDRLAADHPDMLAWNINQLFRREKERRIVRVLDGRARAFVSNKFRLDLDNFDFANMALPQLMQTKCVITSCQITETKLYIKAYRPDVVRQYSKVAGAHLGDGGHNLVHVFRPGLVLSNSEVGDGSMALDNGIREDGCSNLLVWSQGSLRKFHVGRSQAATEGWELFSDETKKASAAAMFAQFGDLVSQSLTNLDLFNKQVDDVIAKMSGVEIARPVQAVKELENTTEKEQDGILNFLIKGGDLSQYGMQAAVTRYAQEEDVSFDRQVQLERLGGRIIELQASEWKEMAQAA